MSPTKVMILWNGRAESIKNSWRKYSVRMNVFPLDLLPLSSGICNSRGVDCGYVICAGRETRNYSSLWIRRSTRTVWKSIFLLLESNSLFSGICNPRGGHCGYVIRAGRETRNHSPLWFRRSTSTSLEINFFVIGINLFVLGDLQSPRCWLRICYPRGCLVHFFFARAKKKPNQRRNSPAARKKAKNRSMFS